MRAPRIGLPGHLVEPVRNTLGLAREEVAVPVERERWRRVPEHPLQHLDVRPCDETTGARKAQVCLKSWTLSGGTPAFAIAGCQTRLRKVSDGERRQHA